MQSPRSQCTRTGSAYRKQFCNLIGLQKSCSEYKSRYSIGLVQDYRATRSRLAPPDYTISADTECDPCWGRGGASSLDSTQRRCAKAYMSHDIPSHARAIIAFLGVETGYGARIKALACTFIGVGGVRPRD